MNFTVIGFMVLQGVIWLLNIYSFIVVVYCVLSWVVSPLSRVRKLFNALVDPVLYPIRAVMDRLFGGPGMIRLDLSPIVLALLIQGVCALLYRLQALLFY